MAAANVLSGCLESYAQQVEYQDNEPPDKPADRTDEHAEHVYGYVIGEEDVGEK